MTEPSTKATPRPWRISHRASDYTYIEQAGGNFYTVVKVCDLVERDANTALIIEAVNAHDTLLAENQRLRVALQKVAEEPHSPYCALSRTRRATMPKPCNCHIAIAATALKEGE